MEMGRQEGWGAHRGVSKKRFTPLPPQVSQADVITPSPCTVPASQAWPDPCVNGRKGNVSWDGVGVHHRGGVGEGPCSHWPHSLASPQRC